MSRLSAITIDVNDLKQGTSFWSQALDAEVEPLSENFTRLKLAGGFEVLLQLVPEPKTSKSRTHPDLETTDLDNEVKRLENLGAAVIKPAQPDGFRFAVMTDPFGNEFCVLENKG